MEIVAEIFLVSEVGRWEYFTENEDEGVQWYQKGRK